MPQRRNKWVGCLGSGAHEWMEGHGGEDDASPYVGGVTKSWLKVKVPGWTDPEDRWKRMKLES